MAIENASIEDSYQAAINASPDLVLRCAHVSEGKFSYVAVPMRVILLSACVFEIVTEPAHDKDYNKT